MFALWAFRAARRFFLLDDLTPFVQEQSGSPQPFPMSNKFRCPGRVRYQQSPERWTCPSSSIACINRAASHTVNSGTRVARSIRKGFVKSAADTLVSLYSPTTGFSCGVPHATQIRLLLPSCIERTPNVFVRHCSPSLNQTVLTNDCLIAHRQRGYETCGAAGAIAHANTVHCRWCSFSAVWVS